MSSGRVRDALDCDEARRVARVIRKRGIDAVAVCFFHAYANGSNEREMRRILEEEHPGAVVATSHETTPRAMEYERFTTTVLNVALIPVMRRYLDRLEAALHVGGYARDVLIAQSAGGLMGTETARRLPVRTANSGPAMGGLAAQRVGRRAGYGNVIGLDIGGTSTDVSVVDGGKLRTTPSWQVEWGHPILFPAIDVVTVGAGGGSVAWFDDGGKLHVGPASMGSDPGPACYLRGGHEPTTTDAHAVTGALAPEAALGGVMRIDSRRAESVVGDKVASVLGVDVVDAAEAILAIAEANMANAIRLATLRRGLDPRDFALVAFGGAGPLHGARVAKDLDVPTVLVPPHPGVTSAMGCLLADIRHDLGASRFYLDSGAADPHELETLFRRFEDELGRLLRREGLDPDDVPVSRNLDMCYAGLWRVLEIPCARPVTCEAISACMAAYHAEHERRFSFVLDRPIEIHGVGVVATAETHRRELKWGAAAETGSASAPGTRQVYWREERAWLDTAVHDRDALRPGSQLTGPVVVEQMDSTTLVPPGMTAVVDPEFNLVISVA
jgi:N-methylhydantoinase A